jgi:hypothetical protein
VAAESDTSCGTSSVADPIVRNGDLQKTKPVVSDSVGAHLRNAFLGHVGLVVLSWRRNREASVPLQVALRQIVSCDDW